MACAREIDLGDSFGPVWVTGVALRGEGKGCMYVGRSFYVQMSDELVEHVDTRTFAN